MLELDQFACPAARTQMPLRRTRSVAVLGAGHGGLALAADLARRGHRVALWNRSPDRVAAVRDRGGVHLTLPGGTAVDASIPVATSHMALAVADAEIVLVAVPASGHVDVARSAAPHLRDGQTVLLLPGRTGGALEFRHVLAQAGCHADVVLGEANTFPLAARTTGAASAAIFGAKAELLAAALPAARNGELLDACRPILPAIVPSRSVLHTGLANVGAILHPVITLGNADRIRRGDRFDFYTDGVTPAVAALLAAADAERLRVARAFGVTVELADRLDRHRVRPSRRDGARSGRQQSRVCRHRGAHDARSSLPARRRADRLDSAARAGTCRRPALADPARSGGRRAPRIGPGVLAAATDLGGAGVGRINAGRDRCDSCAATNHRRVYV